MLSMAVIKSAARASHYYESDDYYLRSHEAKSEQDGESHGLEDLVGSAASGEERSREGSGGGSSTGGAAGEGSSASNDGDGSPVHNTKRAEHEGEWWGQEAKTLGLEGAIQRDDFVNMLKGDLPDGTRLGTTRDGERVHTPGWDLTFSAPKSASILYEVGGDERVFEAHVEAMKDALTWAEQNQASNRERSFIGRINVNTGNLAVAIFQHDTSREHDPNMHGHAVVMNVTERDDGKHVSLDSKSLFDAKMVLGAIYRASYADRLEKIGHEVERTGRDGSFEVRSVPQELIDHFSKRSHMIRESMEERGLEGAVNAAKAALRTRRSKEKIPRERLQPLWQSEAKGLGVDVEQLVKEARERGEITKPKDFDFDRVVKESIKSLAQREASFPREKLFQLAVQASVGHGTVKDVEAAVQHAARDLRIQETERNGRATYITPKAAMRETMILRTFRESQNAVQPILTPEHIDRKLDDTILRDSPKQRDAAKLVLTAQDRFVGIVGRAGTGKTTLLRIVNGIASDADYRLKGMAQNSDAAKVLQTETNIPSSTLKLHLIEANRDEHVLRDRSLLNIFKRREIEAKYAKEIWVVDEGSQVGSRDMRRMMFLADRLGARVVTIFDPHQLAAIDQGKPAIQMLDAGLKHVKLDEIYRQHDPRHRDAVGEVYNAAPGKALDLLAAEIRRVDDPTERLKAMVLEFRSRPQDVRDTSLLATATNQAKTFLNEGVRNILRDEGKLANEVDRTVWSRLDASHMDQRDASFYKEGYVIRFVGGVRNTSIGRGDYFQVEGVDVKKNELKISRFDSEKQETLTWNPRTQAPAEEKAQEIMAPRETSLGKDEAIRWTRNDRHLGLANGEKLKVMGVTDEATVVRKADGTLLQLDDANPAHKHWDHAYSTTFASAQGKTAWHSIVNVGSDQTASLSLKTFLVGISRHRETTQLFMDDPDKVTSNVLKHLGDKTSALEARENTRWSQTTKEIDRLLKDGKQFAPPDPIPQKQLER